jgi:hypothetical protein
MKPELDEALEDLEALSRKRGLPTRHHARPILVALGEALEGGGTTEAGEVTRRLEKLPEAFQEAWLVAVRDEIAMAATEHVRSADPRYLVHPKYDFEYTLEARRRLGARMRAAEALRIAIDPALAASVKRADGLLEKRASLRGPNPSVQRPPDRHK